MDALWQLRPEKTVGTKALHTPGLKKLSCDLEQNHNMHNNKLKKPIKKVKQ